MSDSTLLSKLKNMLADVAAFVASDQASAITGTVVNVSGGSSVD
jgi:enoyl-[acyl-carrier-protein] reductase (NADH)